METTAQEGMAETGDAIINDTWNQERTGDQLQLFVSSRLVRLDDESLEG